MEMTKNYHDFTASSLYCRHCQQAVPVRQRLLLILPEGELHEYLCQYCFGSLGTKRVIKNLPKQIIVP